MRFRPEVALTPLQLAELLLEHYPKEQAEPLEHLNFAIPEFRDMKMEPSLSRGRLNGSHEPLAKIDAN